MITDFLLSVLNDLTLGLLDTMPDSDAPLWIAQAIGFAGLIFAFASSMGVWFPGGTVLVVGASLFLIAGSAFSIRIVRIGISHFTGGGGS